MIKKLILELILLNKENNKKYILLNIIKIIVKIIINKRKINKNIKDNSILRNYNWQNYNDIKKYSILPLLKLNIYKYNKELEKQSLILNKGIIRLLIEIFYNYKNIYITIPIINITTSKIKIRIGYYQIDKKLNNKYNYNNINNIDNINEIENNLSILLNKKINIELYKIKNPLNNIEILNQLITELNQNDNNINKIYDIESLYLNIKNLLPKLNEKWINNSIKIYNNNTNNININNINKSLLFKYTNGIILEVNGKPLNIPTARTQHSKFIIGTFNHSISNINNISSSYINNNKSNISNFNINYNTKNGSYGYKSKLHTL